MINFLRRNAKIVSIIFIIFFIFNTTALSTDINMNLPVDEDNSGEITNAESNEDNSVDSTNDGTTPEGEQNTNEITDLTNEGTLQNDIGGTAAPSGVSSIAQENMSFSNILNILVITGGVILILLAIAILIRLKG